MLRSSRFIPLMLFALTVSASALAEGPGQCGATYPKPTADPTRTYYFEDSDLEAMRLIALAAPVTDSPQQTIDTQTYVETRQLLATQRGLMAACDDVYDFFEMLPRFEEAFGAKLDPATHPHLINLLSSIVDYDPKKDPKKTPAWIVSDLKTTYNRVRPMYQFDSIGHTCIAPDMAGHAKDDIGLYSLPTTPSYPSGHSFRGMVVGLILAEFTATKERAAAVIERGYAFGESRVICGFHWESDVAASRIIALRVVGALKQNTAFLSAMRAARDDFAQAAR